MIDEARPYAEYKSTEVPWLGDIPAHWEVRPLRTLLKQRNEKNRPLKTRQILSLSIAHGVTLYSHEGRGGNKSKSDLTAYKIARKGDIVLNSMNVVVGAVGLSKYTGAISPVYYALYPLSDNVDIHYYNAVFSNHTFQRYLLIYGKGILIKEGDSGKLNTIRMKISSDDLKTIQLPLPTPEEQTAIARYLNWKTVQVQRFIRNRRRLIEVLNEQKQAIINRAVTRGLDPNVPLKPSGIDWLGDVPEHWEVRRLKYVTKRRVNGITPPTENRRYYEDGTIPWFGPSSIGQAICVGSPSAFLNLSAFMEGKARRIAPPALLVEIIASVGKSCLLCQEGATNQQITAFELDTVHAVPDFIALQFRMAEPWLIASASSATIPILGTHVVAATGIAFPEQKEQQEIVSYIQIQTKPTDAAITRAHREIDLIREYRTRLIADVVTGKVDVRHLAPPPGSEDLQETADELEPLDDAAGELEDEALAGEVAHADD